LNERLLFFSVNPNLQKTAKIGRFINHATSKNVAFPPFKNEVDDIIFKNAI
jgi:hypothetical protein